MTPRSREWTAHRQLATVRLAALVLGWMLAGSVASAQESRGVFVSVGAQAGTTSSTFSESLRFREPMLTEDTTFTSNYTDTRSAVFTVAGGVQRVWRHVGVAATISYLDGHTDVGYQASVPHPLAANQPRLLAGSVTGLRNRELAVHVQALCTIPLGSRVDLILSAGPSVFTVERGVLQGVEIDEVPPYTSVKLLGVQVENERQTKAGYNVGTEVVWKVAHGFGVSGIVSYSHARLPLPAPGELVQNRHVDAIAGGLRVGGAVRLMF